MYKTFTTRCFPAVLKHCLLTDDITARQTPLRNRYVMELSSRAGATSHVICINDTYSSLLPGDNVLCDAKYLNDSLLTRQICFITLQLERHRISHAHNQLIICKPRRHRFPLLFFTTPERNGHCKTTHNAVDDERDTTTNESCLRNAILAPKTLLSVQFLTQCSFNSVAITLKALLSAIIYDDRA